MGLVLRTEAGEYLSGRFVTVDGTRLHYVEQGAGSPVVLLHGNGSMVADFVSSGIAELVGSDYRLVTFDRPGFGFSERPRDRTWGPFEQAKLLLAAFDRLNIERPIIVGHSWGTLVALALALEGAGRIAGLVLLSGYYYPVPRTSQPQVTALSGSAFPLVDNMLRQTVMPFVSRMMAPGAVRRVFAPCPVPERFQDSYSIPHALRASQVKAVIEEAAMLADSAKVLSELYKDLSVPVRLIAGSHDRIVETEKHSARLHRELRTSTFRNVPGIGHMVHHAAPQEVAAAINAVSQIRRRTTTAARRAERAPRSWLHLESHGAA